MNLLLDTNVIIDYLGKKEPFYEQAMQIVAAGFFGDATLWMSAGSANDAFFVLDHYIDSERIQKALAALYDVVKPIAVTGEDLVRATGLLWDDYEDCLISIAALKSQADFIITRDAKGFSRSPVPAISPAEWLETMREQGLSYAEVDL